MSEKLKVLDLFSGIGGFSLGLERTGGFETVAFCEIEEFPRKVLKKHWPEVRQFRDVRELKGSDVGAVDLICGGYPCQPFSTAGKRRGKEDDRHLWPEFNRLVAELRPAWVIGENVAGHISMGLDDVFSDLEGQGYAFRTFVIPACALGAHHRRDRCWTIAHTDNVLHQRRLANGSPQREKERSERGDQGQGKAQYRERFRFESGPSSEIVANPKRIGCKQVVSPKFIRASGQGAASSFEHSSFPRGWEGWLTEPGVGRVVDGVSNRVDRLKGIGNAVVPQIPEMIGYAILEAEAA